MNILHIAKINTNQSTGVNVIVPKHLYWQSHYASIFFLNIEDSINTNFNMDGIVNICFDDICNEDFINNIDLVIFHEAYCFKYLQIASILRKHRVRYIILPHGELQRPALLNKPIKKIIANILFWNKFINSSIAIQCLSELEMEQTNFKPLKFVGTNGYAVNEMLNFRKSSDIVFTYIGRLNMYHKGLDLLLKAFYLFKKSLNFKTNIVLNIFGPDYKKRKKRLMQLIKKYKLSDIVNLCDPIYGDKKKEILSNTTFFIQTSRFEGMPLGILEALSYGVPCIVTKGSTLSELISTYDCGYPCENNANSIFNAITRAISSKEITGKRFNAQKLIVDEFNWEEISKNTIDTYKKLLNM